MSGRGEKRRDYSWRLRRRGRCAGLLAAGYLALVVLAVWQTWEWVGAEPWVLSPGLVCGGMALRGLLEQTKAARRWFAAERLERALAAEMSARAAWEREFMRSKKIFRRDGRGDGQFHN